MSHEAVDDVESGRREESNTSVPNPNSALQQPQRQPLGSLHFSAATGLILTYLIEIGVQIFLMVNCCRSFVLVTSDWDWPWFLTISSMLSSLLVTIVSIIWVCRGLDFAGRLCGRLLCYVMHSLLLGLLWRYLKLAFAYDHADVKEFVILRVFQTYIQSLPLTAIHLAWLITFRESCSSLTFCLVVAEMLSVTTALTISSYIKAQEEKEGKRSSVTGDSPLKCSTSAIWFKVIRAELNVVGRVMLICCRMIVVGIIIVHLKYWTSVIILVHFVVCFTWVSFSEKMYESLKKSEGVLNMTVESRVDSRNKFLTRVTRFVYVLFWDVSLNLVGGKNVWTWALPVFLTVVENLAMIMYHWYHQPEFFVTITSGTCLFFGLVLSFSLNFINSSNTLCCSVHPIKSKKKDKSQQTQSLPVIDPSEKTESEESHKVNQENDGMSIEGIGGLNTSTTGTEQSKSCSWDLSIAKPFIVANNYTNISEVLMTKARARASGANGEKRRKNLMKGMSGPPEVLVHRASPPAAPGASVPTLMQSALVPTTTWVPDTCCNDSNGSSNSRNTNTLLESANNPTDQDNDMDIDNPHFVFYYPSKTGVNSAVASEFRKLSQRSGSVSVRTPNSKGGGGGSVRQNAAAKKKTVSPATSFTSFSSLRKIRTSTPVEIRKASRVIMNYPKHHKVTNSKTVSRCLCQVERAPCSGEVQGNDLYDKLMEDSYGILICEGEPPAHSQGRRVSQNSKDETRLPSTLLPSIFHSNKKLKVLCAKCLQNHDPLLTNCLEEEDQDPLPIHSKESTTPENLRYHSSTSHFTNCRVPPIPSIVSVMPNVQSDTTDYPSETEMTWTIHGDDQISMSSHLSTATYTTWPHQSQPNLSMWTTSTMMPQSRFPKEFTSLEYVRTWLLTSQARLRHYHHEKNRAAKKVNRSKTMMSQNSRRARSASAGREVNVNPVPSHKIGLGRRHGPVGRGQSPQSYHEVISITPTFQPPPRQKQHPVLPHSVISHQHREMCAHPDCPYHSTFSNDESDVCYKDLEIVV